MNIDGYPVIPIPVACAPSSPATPLNDEEVVREFLKAGVKEHQHKAELQAFRSELVFLARHGMVRSNGVEFYRCNEPSSAHCSSFLPTATTLLAAISQLGGRLPTPEPHAGMPGHFKSLLQLLGRVSESALALSVDEGLPSLAGQDVLCSRGCNIVGLSTAAQKRHDLLFHFDDRQRNMRRKRNFLIKMMKLRQQRRLGSVCMRGVPSLPQPSISSVDTKSKVIKCVQVVL